MFAKRCIYVIIDIIQIPVTTAPPTGTVTFLFTDIEGSTRLSQQYPEAMPALLARHDEILRQAIEAHNGLVFRITGDSFSAAFQSASDALYAALAGQRALYQESWSPAPIKVRMGIHTGGAQAEADSGEIRYSGYTTLALTQRFGVQWRAQRVRCNAGLGCVATYTYSLRSSSSGVGLWKNSIQGIILSSEI